MSRSHKLPARHRRRDWYALGRAAALRGADFSANPFFSLEDDEHSWNSHRWFCGWFDAQDDLDRSYSR